MTNKHGSSHYFPYEHLRSEINTRRPVNDVKFNKHTRTLRHKLSNRIYTMAEVKYQYSLDENGKLVNINSLTSESRHQHTYRCIGCGNILLPRAIGSMKRRAHFYHKEYIDCSGETYLHKLGKRIIKERFYK